jgi:hydroxymethylpyrimidine pyrophosphatase-like HAD family hydrolase
MRFVALATDYDGTLAKDGVVDSETVVALERLRRSGRRLIVVSGRQLEDLRDAFPRLDLFDRVVAENGAVLYDPAGRSERLLTAAADEPFVDALRRRNVEPLSVGRSVVATLRPHETIVLQTIRELGLDLDLAFNKEAVMVLPAGVGKASGLAAALGDLALSPRNTVGIGDAENDHAFLSACGCRVAVADALPALIERADLVTKAGDGAGVRELVERLLRDDLADLASRSGHR